MLVEKDGRVRGFFPPLILGHLGIVKSLEKESAKGEKYRKHLARKSISPASGMAGLRAHGAAGSGERGRRDPLRPPRSSVPGSLMAFSDGLD